MPGSQVVGREGGNAVSREEARERAAAAAEARAKQQQTRGQQGATSKVKQPSAGAASSHDGKPNLADARTWD